MQPKLTVGMASFRDYYGVWQTVQALRMYNAEVLPVTEILLVDNEPEGPHGQTNRDLFSWFNHGAHAATYIPFNAVRGTSAPRELVMRQAQGEIVLCMDSHVMLAPGALRKLIEWFDARPESRDLVTGPMTYDCLSHGNTHMNDIWRDDMWGVWGNAWQCSCGRTFSTTQRPPDWLKKDEKSFGFCRYLTLDDPQESIENCTRCGAELPTGIAWQGHEDELKARGYRLLGENPDEPAFEIPAAGLGVFACRKDSWPGFNPNFRGFGGEEWYIHKKVRAAGGRCLCLPFLKWLHRYGNPNGHADQRPKWDQFRNYVIGHHELGLPIENVRANMTTQIPDDEWAQLTANPSNPPQSPVAPQAQAGCVGCGQQTIATAVRQPSAWELSPHVAKLREFQALGHVMLMTGSKTREDLSTAFSVHQQAQRFLAVHGIADPGLGAALRNFLHHERAWTVVYRTMDDGGFVVMSKDPQDKQPTPGIMRQALNFAKAAAQHAAAGSPIVDDETFNARLETCMVCEHRNMDHCAKCGCYVDWKCSWADQQCPADPPRWGKALPVVAA